MTCTLTTFHGTNHGLCTPPCASDEHCPAGWFCRVEGGVLPGICVEKGCVCQDIECGPGSLPPEMCPQVHPSFVCIQDPDELDTSYCTRFCSEHGDCPVGFACRPTIDGPPGLCACTR
jgi:hypothetical protein